MQEEDEEEKDLDRIWDAKGVSPEELKLTDDDVREWVAENIKHLLDNMPINCTSRHVDIVLKNAVVVNRGMIAAINYLIVKNNEVSGKNSLKLVH